MLHNTHMSQFIPPTMFHGVGGTWSLGAGAVTNTIAYHNAANDESTVINIPVTVPSNSKGLQGAYLKSVEIDFEILVAACDAVDVLVNKITRGVHGAVAVVAAQTFTYDADNNSGADRLDVDQHKMTVTLTTPIWLDNDEYVLVELTIDKAATTTLDMLSAVANFTLRL
jgi:hypothetical protein